MAANSKICKAFRKHGSKNFSITKLAEASSRDKLLQLEKYYIRRFNSIKHGYNSKR